MTPVQHFHLSAILTSLLNVLLVIFVVGRAPIGRLKRRFAWYGGSIVFWSVFLWLFSSTRDEHLSYLFCQLLHIGAIYIPCFFAHFIQTYLNVVEIRHRILLLCAYIGSSYFLILDLFFPKPFILRVVPKLGFFHFMDAGVLYHYWVALFFCTVVYGHLLLLKGLSEAKGKLQRQRQFFFIGNFIGYLGGIGVFFPVYNITWFPFPYGAYGVALFSAVTVYTIVLFRFIGIEVIIKKTLVFTGLFGVVVGTVSSVVYLLNTYVAHFVGLGQRVSTTIAIVTAMLLYEPTKKFLVWVTDRYLFQKKEDFRKILNRLTSQIITILDLEQVGQTLLSTLRQSLRLESGAILIKDENGESYQILESYGFNPEGLLFPKEGPVIKFLAEREGTINLENEDTRREGPPAVLEVFQKMGTHMVLPLFVHSELIGVLALGKKKSDEEFKSDETDYFPTLAGQVAIALSNARLYDILKKSEVDFAQQSKMAAIGTLSAGIGHEIKNPLAAIKMGVEMLRFNKKHGIYNDLDKAQYEAIVEDVVDRVLNNVDRAVGVIDRLSSFAKKPKEIKIEPVPVEECVDRALALLAKELENYNIEVQKEIRPHLPPVVADKVQMEEICLNLLVNARHAIREKGRITVRGEMRNGEVELTFEDTGSGIAKEFLDKIFDPFFTTKDVSRNPDKEAIKGTGLGLFLVREFVKKFGGRIAVESEVGRGTAFHIFLKTAESNALHPLK